ncbi:lysophospholipid acyltransferase family protein [Aminiphilus sp.]|jgi:1-acyl-sn-glycerol-3-phosphate acyltransferase|uniref:lysophospholipid acyltransferase family protein n=1 Tax=Aminiphilus sp. TaxID=1872488 RepID=UPI0026222E7F|nr:lysophospholipid acyltransferase family protein [Aminiphilus sp.]
MKTLKYFLVRFFCKLYLLLYHRCSVSGLEGVPQRRPLIIASNHCSHLDPIAVGVSYPERLRFLAKEELFRVPFIGFVVSAVGAVPVAREDSQRAGVVLKILLELLESGESVVLFPEGHRSKDGRLQKLEGGVALLASRTMTPVLPVFVDGGFRAMPPGAGFPRPGKLRVVYGETIYPEQAPEGCSEKGRRQWILEELERRLQSMEADFRAGG